MVDAYVAQFPADVQERLIRLRGVIGEHFLGSGTGQPDCISHARSMAVCTARTSTRSR